MVQRKLRVAETPTGLRLPYARWEPEKTALFQVVQQHLLTFEQEWIDKYDGGPLPSFVTGELHHFLGCGILTRGLPNCSVCIFLDGIYAPDRDGKVSCSTRPMDRSSCHRSVTAPKRFLRFRLSIGLLDPLPAKSGNWEHRYHHSPAS
jgi:hypothetical protein